MICCRYQPPSACAEWMFALWLVRFILQKRITFKLSVALLNILAKTHIFEMCFLLMRPNKIGQAGYSNFKRLTSSYPTVDRKHLINFDMEHSAATVAVNLPLGRQRVITNGTNENRSRLFRNKAHLMGPPNKF